MGRSLVSASDEESESFACCSVNVVWSPMGSQGYMGRFNIIVSPSGVWDGVAGVAVVGRCLLILLGVVA